MRGDAMKRLTEKRDCGSGILYWLSCPDARYCAGGCAQCDTVDKAIDRLGEYEDTGLTPEEIERSKMEIEAGCVKAVARTYGIDINRLRQLAEADRDGCVIVLPCKVGDTVWTNISIRGDRYRLSDRPYPIKVVFFGNGGKKRFFHVEYSNGRVFPFDESAIGKRVFLTREEAERALEGKSDG